MKKYSTNINWLSNSGMFAALLGIILTVALSSAAQTENSSRSEQRGRPLILQANLDQSFVFIACPANTPTGSFCVNITATGSAPGFGDFTVTRFISFDLASYNPAQPSCVKAFTRGTVTFERGGTLAFNAPGQLCPETGIDVLELVVTGGTGRYANAVGGGQITGTPPVLTQTGGTARELWDAQIYLARDR